MAERTLQLLGSRLQSTPHAMPQMLVVADCSLDKPKQIIIAGKPNAPDTRAMLRAVHERFIPNKILLLADGGKGQDYLGNYLPFVKSMTMLNGKATAYICEDYACQLPVADLQMLLQLLAEKPNMRAQQLE
ncbi:MAG: hypothetical protein ALAOOOJD_03254 [bacterium]|nr:hypothetical protein [bacterium]